MGNIDKTSNKVIDCIYYNAFSYVKFRKYKKTNNSYLSAKYNNYMPL